MRSLRDAKMRSLPALLWQFFREMHSSENRVAHLPTKCTIFLGEKAPRLASLKIEIAFSQLSRILDIAPRADSKENRAFRHFLCQAVSPSVHFGMFCAKQCLRLLAPPLSAKRALTPPPETYADSMLFGCTKRRRLLQRCPRAR